MFLYKAVALKRAGFCQLAFFAITQKIASKLSCQKLRGLRRWRLHTPRHISSRSAGLWVRGVPAPLLSKGQSSLRWGRSLCIVALLSQSNAKRPQGRDNKRITRVKEKEVEVQHSTTALWQKATGPPARIFAFATLCVASQKSALPTSRLFRASPSQPSCVEWPGWHYATAPIFSKVALVFLPQHRKAGKCQQKKRRYNCGCPTHFFCIICPQGLYKSYPQLTCFQIFEKINLLERKPTLNH